jgi:NADPH-dependent glutamate synthase beta subunit-like oxidoreductase
MEQYFDERPGVVLNEHGRIDGASKQLAGLYTSGWLKRGPSGIIGTNISDAKETVATIVRDLDSAGSNDGAASGDLESLLNERSVDVVRWEDYLRIEDEERRSRRSDIQPREKIVDLEGLMKAAYSK